MDMTSLWGRLAKLQSFFQDGLNVDENSHLPEADLRKISLGNLYVYQQQGVLNTFETGVTPSVRKVILGEYFGITDRDSAIETLNWLSQAPSQTMFHYAYTAFLQGGGNISRKWLNENEELKEHTDSEMTVWKSWKRWRKNIRTLNKLELSYPKKKWANSEYLRGMQED